MLCSWRNTRGLLVSYLCGADVTLVVDLYHEFCVINLDGPLFICTKEEQRAVIRFLWAEGVPGAEMHRRISVQYGNSVVSQRMVYEWIERFKNGRTSIKHEEGVRRPFTSITDVNTEWVGDMIQHNRWVTIDEVAHQLQISHCAAYAIIHNRLAFHKSVHDGSQRESQNWTKWNVRTAANGFWITVVLKVTTSWKGSSREIKHGSTVTNQRLNAKVWNGNIPTCPPSKSSECIQLQKACAYSFLGLTRASTGTL